MIANVNCAAAASDCEVLSQAATSDNEVILNQNSLLELLYDSFQSNYNSCETYDLIDKQMFSSTNDNAHLIIHVNIYSLQLYIDELEQFLKCMKTPPSVLLLSETRINVHPHTNVDIPGYTFVHFPSPTIVGGVGAYFSNLMTFTEIENLKMQIRGCEDQWFKVQFSGQRDNYIFAVIYRHPWDNADIFLNALDEKLQKLNKKRSKVILMGDINIDLNNESSLKSQYMHTIESNAFSNLITKPTRVTADSETIIDHLLTNDTESVITPGVFLYKLADHYAIYCIVSNPNFKDVNKRHNLFTFRNFHSVDGTKFRNDLESSLTPLILDAINSLLTHSSLDQNINRLVTAISEVIEKRAPLQTASRRRKRIQSKPWLTKGLLISIKTKQALYKQYFLSNNEFGKWYYKKYANKLTRVKILAKKLHYFESIKDKKNNPKELWKVINSAIPSKCSSFLPITKMKVGNTEVDERDEITEHFNNYFVEIGHLIAKSVSFSEKTDFKSFLKNSVSETIVLDPPQPIEVFNAINSLNLHKASGCDNISSFFLRMGNDTLAPMLSFYFGLVFELGFFPHIFKTSKVVPIFKSGDKHLVQNYRPISLSPCLSKVLEKVIKNQLTFLKSVKFSINFNTGLEKSVASCMHYWMLSHQHMMRYNTINLQHFF